MRQSLRLQILLSVLICIGLTFAFSVNKNFQKLKLPEMKMTVSDDDEEIDNSLPSSGSFFHKVPSGDGNNSGNIEDKQDVNPFDEDLKKAMDARTLSRAKTESTLNGLPTKGGLMFLSIPHYTRMSNY